MRVLVSSRDNRRHARFVYLVDAVLQPLRRSWLDFIRQWRLVDDRRVLRIEAGLHFRAVCEEAAM